MSDPVILNADGRPFEDFEFDAHNHDDECEMYSEACGCDSRKSLLGELFKARLLAANWKSEALAARSIIDQNGCRDGVIEILSDESFSYYTAARSKNEEV